MEIPTTSLFKKLGIGLINLINFLFNNKFIHIYLISINKYLNKHLDKHKLHIS